MGKSKFGWESYGRLKLALPIRRGGAKIRAYPCFPICPNLLSYGMPCSASMAPGTHILGP